MTERLKAAAPLAISVGILAAVWLEISLNFSFHWITEGNLGNGLALPANFSVVAPAALVSWSMFFAEVLTGPQQAKWRSPPLSVPLARSCSGSSLPRSPASPTSTHRPHRRRHRRPRGPRSCLQRLLLHPCRLLRALRRYVLVDRDRAGRLGTRRGRDRQHGRSSPLARNGGIRGFPRRSVHPARMGLHLQRGLVARWARSRPGVRQARRRPDPRHAAVRQRANRVLIDQAPIARRRDASFAVSRSAPLQETL
jgi:hypothetical protein